MTNVSWNELMISIHQKLTKMEVLVFFLLHPLLWLPLLIRLILFRTKNLILVDVLVVVYRGVPFCFSSRLSGDFNAKYKWGQGLCTPYPLPNKEKKYHSNLFSILKRKQLAYLTPNNKSFPLKFYLMEKRFTYINNISFNLTPQTNFFNCLKKNKGMLF